jgi:hypothetical protein
VNRTRIIPRQIDIKQIFKMFFSAELPEKPDGEGFICSHCRTLRDHHIARNVRRRENKAKILWLIPKDSILKRNDGRPNIRIFQQPMNCIKKVLCILRGDPMMEKKDGYGRAP